MKSDFLLTNDTAKKLYESCASLPVIDYHCHLSPKEIYEDQPFDSIGEMWLGGDHYKWRLMRACGIPEEKITGNAPMRDKFRAYAAALQYAAGNPLYSWSHMELSRYFGIDETLREDNADKIWEKANAYIRENQLSPVKLITDSGVKVICTTDDPADSLEWHRKIKGKYDAFRVMPSFRTDRILLVRADDYADYIRRLSCVSGVSVIDLKTLKEAIEKRLVFFVKNGCRVTDLGIQDFPKEIYGEEQAAEVYHAILDGKEISDEDYSGLLGNLIVFLAGLYKKYDLIMQWHFAVVRNVNTMLYTAVGADSGIDCVGDTVSGSDLIAILDAINSTSGMPRMILYSLNSVNAAQIASVAGAYPNIRLGTAWWFCDHKRGITEQMQVISEIGCFGTFLGMLTDSRSFLSYARHDYFRRILCSFIGEMAENDEYDEESAYELVKRICYTNIREWIEGERV